MPRKLRQDARNQRRRAKRQLKQETARRARLDTRVKMTARGPGKVCLACETVKLVDGSDGLGGYSLNRKGYPQPRCRPCNTRYLKRWRPSYRERIARYGKKHFAAAARGWRLGKGRWLAKEKRLYERALLTKRTQLATRCRDCPRYRVRVGFAWYLKEQACQRFEADMNTSTLHYCCDRYDVYVEQQKRYAEHLAKHWARAGERRHDKALRVA